MQNLVIGDLLRDIKHLCDFYDLDKDIIQATEYISGFIKDNSNITIKDLRGGIIERFYSNISKEIIFPRLRNKSSLNECLEYNQLTTEKIEFFENIFFSKVLTLYYNNNEMFMIDIPFCEWNILYPSFNTAEIKKDFLIWLKHNLITNFSHFHVTIGMDIILIFKRNYILK